MVDFTVSVQSVVNVENRSAGVAENGVNALFDKAVNQNVCAFHLHSFLHTAQNLLQVPSGNVVYLDSYLTFYRIALRLSTLSAVILYIKSE